MTLQQGIVDPAFKLLGLIASGRTMATGEYADALDAVNALLDMSSAEEEMILQIAHETFAVTGAQSYTMGPAATFNTARPIRIRAAAVIAPTGASQGVRVLTAEQFAAEVEDRTAVGAFADRLTCDYVAPISTLYLNPAPGLGQLELWSLKALTNFAAMTDAVTLAQGYLEYLKFNLAVNLAPAFAGAKLTDSVVAKAQATKAGLRDLYRRTLGDPLEPAPAQ